MIYAYRRTLQNPLPKTLPSEKYLLGLNQEWNFVSSESNIKNYSTSYLPFNFCNQNVHFPLLDITP